MNIPKLSAINPDFNDIAAQLRNSLSDKASFRALLETDTSSILLESIAAVGTFLMGAIQNAVEEKNTDSAKLDSSLKAIARSLGVRLQRKTPASATVTLNIPAQTTTYTIPAYSQFNASGKKLFNREAIVIPPGVTSVPGVTLREGLVQRVEFLGTGQPFQLKWLDIPGFTVSDQDVLLTADNQPVKVVTDAIWHYQNAESNTPTVLTRVVQDRTLPTGELELLFGNNLYGFNPPNASTMILTYVVTNGKLGNSTGFMNQRLSLEDDPIVTGVSNTILGNGADEPNAEVYRNSPLVYAAYGRAVSIDDHEALALQYGDIADARFMGQQLIAPTLKEFMNVVYVYALKRDNTQFSSSEFREFRDWLMPKAIPLTYVRKYSVAIPVSVTANIYIRNTGDPNTVESSIRREIDKLFLPSKGALGRNMYLSDIYDTIVNADQNIDFIQVLEPKGDIICRIDAPTNIVLTSSNTGTGTLVPGTTYTYSVSAFNEQGQTFASPIVQIVVPPGHNTVRVAWPAVPGATGYSVFGRVGSDMRRVGPVITATLLQDTGLLPLVDSVNLENTSGLYHATRNTVTLNINYTNRK